jgi:hypothetical protein
VPPIGVHSPGYVAETDAQAREDFFPDYKRRKRPGAPPMIASIIGRPYCAARTTEFGLPPTPIQGSRCSSPAGR